MQEYDYVIVGAGVAGCVLAARLTENPRVSVALLESGPDNEVEATEYVVGAYSTWSGPLNWGYKTLPQVGLAGRELDSPRGRVVGGSAAINGGSWSRGIAADYDAWGVEGWGWATALATFRAVEASDRGDGAWRGANGPMALETMPRGTFMTEAFRDASRELGVGETADHNGAVFEGFDRWETIFPGGRRRNTAKAYLEPARTRANLSVFTGATARRVVLGNGRSTGVQTSIDDKQVNIAARREVILAAGAYGTPQLLMLSGIGPGPHLREHGIEVAVDAGGVGQNLSEPLRTFIGAAAPPGSGLAWNPDPEDATQLARWRRRGDGPLTTYENTAVAFTRSKPELDHPDVELMFNINPPFQFRKDPQLAGWTINVALILPESRGSVTLASPDPGAAPAIDPAALSNERDVVTYLRALRIALAYGSTRALAPFTQKHAVDPAASDDALREHLRAAAELVYHPTGTVRLGTAHDRTAPLDPQLRVKGIDGLRVADASAIPIPIRGHSMAPTLYVAERAAAFLSERETRVSV